MTLDAEFWKNAFLSGSRAGSTAAYLTGAGKIQSKIGISSPVEQLVKKFKAKIAKKKKKPPINIKKGKPKKKNQSRKKVKTVNKKKKPVKRKKSKNGRSRK